MSPRKPLSVVFIFTISLILSSVFVIAALAETDEIVRDETGIYYTVKKGDTLWDLSKKFLDSEYQWPEMWKENKQIPNPHWIYPGERIKLYEDTSIQNFGDQTAGQDVPMEGREAPYFLYSAIDHVGFIRKEPIKTSGKIFKVMGDSATISIGDLVYIEPQNNISLVPGSRFTIVREMDPVKDKQTGELYGTQHYFTGLLEITRTTSKFAVAKVVENYREVQINDEIIPYSPRSPKIVLHDSTKGILSKIICPEEISYVFGEDSIAFIDKGSNDGIKTGQRYSLIYEENVVMDKDTEEMVQLTPEPIGSILVLLTEPTTATVLITQSQQEMHAGTIVRTPAP